MPFPFISLDLIDAVARPSSFVQSQVDSYTGSYMGRIVVTTRLTGFYIVNIVLYAGPLTLAGFGRSTVEIEPGPLVVAFLQLFTDDVAALFDFGVRLIQNSAFLLVASILVFATFHLGMLLTRSSQGALQSVHTVTFSIGIYLAAVFTLVWYIATAEGIAVADEWLVAIQKDYVYFFIDVLGVNVGLPGGRPDPVNIGNLTLQGQLAMAALGLTILYFLYTLYLGARINHHASRFESLVAVSTVSVSPAAYVIGSIAIAVFIDIQAVIGAFAV